MVSIPRMNAMDYVFWHSDMCYTVEKVGFEKDFKGKIGDNNSPQWEKSLRIRILIELELAELRKSHIDHTI